MKKYMLELPDITHKALKLLATEKEITMKELILESIEYAFGEGYENFLTSNEKQIRHEEFLLL